MSISDEAPQNGKKPSKPGSRGAVGIVDERDDDTLPLVCSSLLCDVSVNPEPLVMRKITREGLDLDYIRFFRKSTADYVFRRLESEIEYFKGDLLKIRVYGKWRTIPRKQVSYGDKGMSYAFSGTRLPAKPWTPLLQHLRDLVAKQTGHRYNFVLVNRYKDGSDHMGEHKGRRERPRPHCTYRIVVIWATSRLCSEAWGCKAQAVGPRVNLTFRRLHAPNS
ncbi:hypothetical protein MTO96_009982 [Rhipicephalus appendiculatus]